MQGLPHTYTHTHTPCGLPMFHCSHCPYIPLLRKTTPCIGPHCTSGLMIPLAPSNPLRPMQEEVMRRCKDRWLAVHLLSALSFCLPGQVEWEETRCCHLGNRQYCHWQSGWQAVSNEAVWAAGEPAFTHRLSASPSHLLTTWGVVVVVFLSFNSNRMSGKG